MLKRLMLTTVAAGVSVGCLFEQDLGKNGSSELNGTGGAAGAGNAASGGSSSGGSSSGGSSSGGSSSGGSSSGGSSSGGSSSGGTGGSGGIPSSANPPSGYTKCGSGTFDQAQAKQACESVWDDPTFGVLHDPTEKHPSACSSLAISKGEYEVWCDPATDDFYLYAKIEGVKQVDGVCSAEVPHLVGAEDFFTSDPGWHGSNSAIVWHEPYASPTAVVELHEASSSKNGAGKIWVGGRLWSGANCIDQSVYTTLTGFNFAWFEN